jgi:hypothetical protein
MSQWCRLRFSEEENPTRREILVGGAGALMATAFAFAMPSRSFTNPLGKPVGLELYTVRAELDKDNDRTLRQIAAVGYQEVETGISPKRKAADLKESRQDAGLNCRSLHMGFGGMYEAGGTRSRLGRSM